MELQLPFDLKRIFNISDGQEFEDMALAVFKFQYENNQVYNQFCRLSKRDLTNVHSISEIPFLPISFFKTHEVICGSQKGGLEFQSSGTTGSERSKHFVYDPTLYELSFIKAFEHFYGHFEDYIFLGLLPTYIENKKSSLIYMIDYFVKQS